MVQDLVGLAISTLLLGDFSLVLLTLLHLYSLSLADIFLVLTILPLGILIPFPAGINALFSHGPRRSAALARLYALWNISSFINTVSCSDHFGTSLLNSYKYLTFTHITCNRSRWTSLTKSSPFIRIVNNIIYEFSLL